MICSSLNLLFLIVLLPFLFAAELSFCHVQFLGVRSFPHIYNRKMPEEIVEQISQIRSLIGWADSFGMSSAARVPLSPSVSTTRTVLRFRDKYMAEDRNVLTGYDASEGALYILFAAVLCLHPSTPKLFAIDNADHGLNPVLARRLIECVCKWVLQSKQTRQILLTSHNPLILDGLPLQDERVRLFTVDRSSDGKSVVNRIKVTDELIKKAKEGWTLSRLWVMGHLGGIPNV